MMSTVIEDDASDIFYSGCSAKPSGVNLPVPSLPAGGAAFWLQIHFDLNDIDTPCARLRHKQNPEQRTYIAFPPELEVRERKYVIVTDVTVTDMMGVTHCGQQMPLELGPSQLQQHGTALWFNHAIKCPNITAGTWTVILTQRDHPHPFVYSVTVNVVDENPPEIYEEQAVKLADYLWSVDDVMINDDDVERFYTTPGGNGQNKREHADTQQNNAVPDSPDPEKCSDIDKDHGLPTSQLQRAIRYLLEFHDCILLILLSVVTTAVIYYLCFSLFSIQNRRRGKFGLTTRFGTVIIGFIGIYQLLLYVQLDLRFTSAHS